MAATETEKEVIRQYQDPEDLERNGKKKSMTFRVLRAFYLDIRRGPAVVVSPADVVELHDRYLISNLFFAGKINPMSPGIPASAEYLALKTFQTVNAEGCYQDIPPMTLLRLSRSEAFDLLKKRLAKPVNEADFYLP